MDKTIAFLIAAFLVALPLIALWIGFAEKRKAREEGRREGGQAASMMGAGLMEVQNLLEPERKIEVVREEERMRDLLVEIDEEGDDKRG